MGRKITSIRLDVRNGKVGIRTQSKSLRGTGFTLKGVEHPGEHYHKAAVKLAIVELLKEILP